MTYGRIDSSSIQLGAKHWTFALPRHLHWATVRKTPPCIQEPAGRYFIHCIQHWIIRFPTNYENRFRKFAADELNQETILVDNYGQVYVIDVLSGMPNDWGVRYFTIQPDSTLYTEPLSISQIDAVKSILLPEKMGEEGLPSWASYEKEAKKRIQKAIAAFAITTATATATATATNTYTTTDPATECATILELQQQGELVGTRPMNPAPLEEPIVEDDQPKRYLSPRNVRALQEAYIYAQYSRIPEEKEEALQLLASYLRGVMPKQFHARINSMNRTMLSRRLVKYYDITFPKSTDKSLPPPTDEPYYVPVRINYDSYAI